MFFVSISHCEIRFIVLFLTLVLASLLIVYHLSQCQHNDSIVVMWAESGGKFVTTGYWTLSAAVSM